MLTEIDVFFVGPQVDYLLKVILDSLLTRKRLTTGHTDSDLSGSAMVAADRTDKATMTISLSRVEGVAALNRTGVLTTPPNTWT
jgi:hypothetical protein